MVACVHVLPMYPYIYMLSGIPSHLFAEEVGGALLNDGLLAINDTAFTENSAGEGGLAIQSTESSIIPQNVTFDRNAFSCPS